MFVYFNEYEIIKKGIFLVQQKFGSEIFLGPKKIGWTFFTIQKKFVEKNGVKKKFGSEKNCVKVNGVKKNSGLTIFLVKINSNQIFLGG